MFENDQQILLKIQDKTFDNKQLLKDLQELLNNRFGITKNIDDKIYDIKLEFTNVTGSLVQKYTWHHSQKFILHEGNYIMTMKCGINRELLGWIFQWMYNVRILEPLVLTEYYSASIKKMNTIDSSLAFVYNNIFKP